MASTKKRTLVKGLTWRFISVALTVAIIGIMTSSIKGAMSIGIVDFFIKFTLYYTHERAWKKITWGKF